MGREYELKYEADAQTLSAILRGFPGVWHRITMETVYYDTPERYLASRKWTLRRRLENGQSVCALKTPGDARGSGEWEVRCDRIEDALLELCKLGAPQVTGSLSAVCGVRFLRQAQTIVWKGSALELALDEGVFLGGEREQPFAVVEVELKQGSPRAADEFGAALAEQFALTAQPLSKFQRACALCAIQEA